MKRYEIDKSGCRAVVKREKSIVVLGGLVKKSELRRSEQHQPHIVDNQKRTSTCVQYIMHREIGRVSAKRQATTPPPTQNGALTRH